MKRHIHPFAICLLLFLFLSTACRKKFLEEKPNSKIIQPNSISDLQGLLDNFEVLNQNYPSLSQLSCDEYYYLSKANWQSARTATERNSYIWDKDVYGGEIDVSSWNGPYASIFYVNNILESAKKIAPPSEDQLALNNVVGAAYFFRAYNYFELLKSYAPVYDESTAVSDPGVPLRLTPDIDELFPRASLKQCYDQVIIDLTEAKELLAGTVPSTARNRPSKLAAYALFARIYLSMRKYDLAYRYADSTLNFYKKLINYNTVSLTASTPFSLTNDETILSTNISSYNAITYRNTEEVLNVDTLLMSTYGNDDLRKVVFFTEIRPGIFYVRRGYFGSGIAPYNGLATDEMYLIKAETAARLDKTDVALASLNELLSQRFRTGSFIPLTAGTSAEALELVLAERRKELVWRGLRWDDLRRFNKEGANITLYRNLDGETYELPPNSPRWVFNIPQDEINYSGIKQNDR